MQLTNEEIEIRGDVKGKKSFWEKIYSFPKTRAAKALLAIVMFIGVSGSIALYNVFDDKVFTLHSNHVIDFLNGYEQAYVEFLNTRDLEPLKPYVIKGSKAYEKLDNYREDLNRTIHDNREYTSVKFLNEKDYVNNSIFINGVDLTYELDGKTVEAPNPQEKVFVLAKSPTGKWKLKDTLTRE